MSISVFKKIVTLFMALVMASGIVYTVSADAQTEGERYSVNYNMASNILGKDEFGQDTIANRTFSYYSESYDTMAELIVDQATPEFLNSVAIWETANLIFEPEDAAKKAIDAKGYYMTVILSMLKVGYATDSTAKKVYDFADLSKPVVSIANSFADVYKDVTNLELSDFLSKSSYTADEIKGIKKAQKKFLEDNNYVATSDAADKILKALELITKPQEYVDKFIEYCMISEMSNEWRQIIINMYNCCDKTNIPLTEALETLVKVSGSWRDAAQQILIDMRTDIAVCAYSALVDVMVDAIISECPFIKGMKIGYAIGEEISNMLFSTDKTIESFYICRAYGEVLDTFKDSIAISVSDFRRDPTEKNASKFVLHVDVLFEMLHMGNKYAMDMANAVYRSGISNFIVSHKEAYEKYEKYYNEFESLINDAYKVVSTYWINDLYGVDNELYEYFCEMFGGCYGKVLLTEVQFEYDSVVWGTEDEIYTGLEYYITPYNASFPDMVFYSTDLSVVDFDHFNEPIVNGVGQCTVYVVSADPFYEGKIYDTLTVTVVEGHGKDGIDIPELTPIEPNIPEPVDFKYSIADNEVTIHKYTGNLPSIIIPDKIDGFPVTSIAESAFKNDNTITNVVIPESLRIIGDMAFYNCDNLTSVTFYDGVTWIGEEAFYECDSLDLVELPKSVTSIGSYAFTCNTIYYPNSTEKDYSSFDYCDIIYSYDIGNKSASLEHVDESVYSFSFADVLLGYTVNSIAEDSFKDCTHLTDMIIPDTIDSIGEYAFWGCTNLSNVVLPDNITIIVNGMFSDCKSLINITIPDKVTSIDECAFSGCSGLSEIDIPNSVKIIGDNAFSGCSGLSEIDIPDSVITIGNNVFENCTLLNKVVIPESVTSLGSFRFHSSNITVFYPESTTFNESGIYWTFSGCFAAYSYNTKEERATLEFVNPNLTSYDIEETIQSIPLTDIGVYAFEDCALLSTITLPNSVINVSNSAFDNCLSLTVFYPATMTGFTFSDKHSKVFDMYSYDESSKTASLEWVNGFVNSYDVRDSVLEFPVTSIGTTAVCYRHALEKVSLPSTITKIGAGAFSGCSKLHEIILPETIKEIEDHAFSNCSELKQITIPKGCTYLGSWPFDYCSNLTLLYHVNTPLEYHSLTGVYAAYAYDSDSKTASLSAVDFGVTEYVILEKILDCDVISIGDEAFRFCRYLEEITIPKSIVSIGARAFECCYSLSKINMHDNISMIGESAFSSCTELINISLPKNLTAISDMLFEECTKLETISLPDNVLSVGEKAFNECTGLSSVTLPDSVMVMGEEVFGKCTALKEIKLPNNMRAIETFTFRDCINLEKVMISSSVTEIATSAFQGCPNVVIYGYSGSYAETYSKIHNIPFVTLQPAVPTSITATPIDSSVILNWKAVDGATKYAVYIYQNNEYTCLDSNIKATSYTATDLTNGTKYGFKLKAYAGAWSAASTMVYATPNVANIVPQNVKASAGDGQATITWDEVAGATKYAVYIYENGKYVCLDSNIKGTSYTVADLTNGTKYGFKVKAYVGKWSAASAMAYATPVGNIVPQNVKAVAGDGQATITWDAVNGATKYAVYSYLDGEYTCLDSSITTTSYTATDLANGTKYGFKVKAYVGKWSAASAMVYAIPVTADIVPQNVRAVAGNCEATVKWDAVSGATRYAVYSYLDGQYTLLDSNVKATTYTATDLTNGTKYGFKVKAYVGKWSAASKIAYTTPTTSTVPQGVKAVAGNGEVTVKWNEVAGAEKYAVYIYIDGKYTCITSEVTYLSYVVTNLTNGTKYGFKVKACVNGKWSAASLISYATPTE